MKNNTNTLTVLEFVSRHTDQITYKTPSITKTSIPLAEFSTFTNASRGSLSQAHSNGRLVFHPFLFYKFVLVFPLAVFYLCLESRSVFCLQPSKLGRVSNHRNNQTLLLTETNRFRCVLRF